MNTVIDAAAVAKTSIDELAINHIGLILWVSLFLLVFMVASVIAFVKIAKYMKAMHLQNRRDYQRYNKILTESASYHAETETLLAILYDLLMSHSSDMLNKATELRTNIYLASCCSSDHNTVMLNTLLTLLDKPDLSKTAEFIEDIYGDGEILDVETQKIYDRMMRIVHDNAVVINSIDKDLTKLEASANSNRIIQDIHNELQYGTNFHISENGEKKLQPAKLNPEALTEDEEEQTLSHGTFIMVG